MQVVDKKSLPEKYATLALHQAVERLIEITTPEVTANMLITLAQELKNSVNSLKDVYIHN